MFSATLEPLPLPEGAWQAVTLDFIDGLPQSNKANCILVVVDKFTRYVHFLPLSHPFTAAKVAHSYLDNVYKLHGLPAAIISDRDTVFTSKFWKELFRIIGIELNVEHTLPSLNRWPNQEGEPMLGNIFALLYSCMPKSVEPVSFSSRVLVQFQLPLSS